MLPSWLIPLIAVVVLTVQHVRSRHAVRSKYVVVGLAALSVLLGQLGSVPLIGVVLFQMAICGYVILHQVVTATDDAPPARP